MILFRIRILDSGFNSRFRVQRLRLRVEGLRLGAKGLGFRV